jgi:hypothetical protein
MKSEKSNLTILNENNNIVNGEFQRSIQEKQMNKEDYIEGLKFALSIVNHKTYTKENMAYRIKCEIRRTQEKINKERILKE